MGCLGYETNPQLNSTIGDDNEIKVENPLDNKKINKHNIKNIREKESNDLIPPDQYFCPKCGEIPELVNIYTDIGMIILKCREHENKWNIEQYFEELPLSKYNYYNTKCCKCNNIQKKFKGKDQIFKYCYLCKENYCSDCVKKEEHPKNHLVQCIPVNALSSKCKEHYNEDYTSFCRDCKENICNINSSKDHLGHDKLNLFKIEPKIKLIIEKNRLLSNIIKFNELIINTYEKNQNNYFHTINAAILAKSIEMENSRNLEELKNASKRLEIALEKSKNAIKEFNKRYKTAINGKEKNLSLINKGIDDEGFKLLMQIHFEKLKNLDLSKNKITEIESIKNMANTSNLQVLNLNNNYIDKIDVLKDLILINLKELGLKDNKLKEASVLLELDLPSLELIRIDGNEIDYSLDEFKKVVDKYSKNIVYLVHSFKDFNKKYNTQITETEPNKIPEINLENIEGGKDILYDLYIISSNYDKITFLKLSNCYIEDISYLGKMSFEKLRILDLSLNKIKNIEIFAQMKLRDLEHINLEGNEINDITPLKLIKSSYLIEIKLKDNKNIDENNKDIKNLIKDLKSIVKILFK